MTDQNFFIAFEKLQKTIETLMRIAQEELKETPIAVMDLGRYKNWIFVEMWSRPNLVIKIEKEMREIWQPKS